MLSVDSIKYYYNYTHYYFYYYYYHYYHYYYYTTYILDDSYAKNFPSSKEDELELFSPDPHIYNILMKYKGMCVCVCVCDYDYDYDYDVDDTH